MLLLIPAVLEGQEWQSGSGYRFRALPAPPAGNAGFDSLSSQQTGLVFTNHLPESRHLTNQILPSGSGVSAGDANGDGWCDLFFCGLGGGSRFFLNRGGWRFQDATQAAGLGCPDLDATGAAFADLDADGDLDLLVNSIGNGLRVFFNDGQGRFTRGRQNLNLHRGPMSLALADADGDGDLDLYIANYRTSALMDSPGTRFSVQMVNGKPVVSAVNGRPLTDPEWTNRFRFKIEMQPGGRGKFAHEELGEADLFCLNNGQGQFEPVSWTGGSFLDEHGQPLDQPPFDWGLSVVFRDFNGDGSPDLYICNDFNSPDRFWLNNGRGQFRASPHFALRQSPLSAMTVDVADINRDGHDDFIVMEMLSRVHQRRLVQRNMLRTDSAQAAHLDGRPQYSRNMLYLNRGDGTYAEIAHYAGLEASEWSWAPLFIDVDLDGYEDLLVVNGFERDNMNIDAQNRINQAKASKKVVSKDELTLRRFYPRLDTKNLAFRNRGDLRFEEVSQLWGFDTPTISQGACLADLDNDGDLDVAVNNMNHAAGLYRNDGSAPRLAVRLKGEGLNLQGIGARLTVTGGPVPQSQEMMAGGRYLSSDQALRVFAAGSPTNRLRLEVAWRGGKRSLVTNVLPNCLYEVDEAQAQPAAPALAASPPSAPPFFEDQSQRLNHRHQEAPFDDFARQPLLPKRLSQLGPGVAWWDMDGDGWEDLFIGGGRGGQGGWFQNDRQGGWRAFPAGAVPASGPLGRDQAGVAGWKPGALLVGAAHYEDGLAVGPAAHLLRAGQTEAVEVAPAWAASAGPLAVADYDGDGQLDLLIGGRVNAGQYPAGGGSELYRGQGSQWVLDEANSRVLAEAGLVSGAVWSELDGAGGPELVLACEWGPVRIYRYEGGRLREITRELGLEEWTGWWNGVTTGDLDGDGRLDIIATNWGQNTKHQSHRQKPLRLYYGRFNEDDHIVFLESYFEPRMNQYVPSRMLDMASRAMPFLAERFPTHQAWASASIQEVLKDRRDAHQYLEANCLESMVFLNRGSRFEARVLPSEAQWAPAFAACIADYNGDGHEDVFLSQNFFDVEPETSRYDAGLGLWLRGDGTGNLQAVPAQESGIRVYGEQRGAAVGDYDGDGRVDLVVSQNNAPTRLFRNAGGQPGLRLRLQGPENNPHAIGAIVRLKFRDRFGPAREVHAGSGYWSQDSVVQVFGQPAVPTQVWIRWPGGKTTTSDLPSGARQIEVNSQGQIRAIP